MLRKDLSFSEFEELWKDSQYKEQYSQEGLKAIFEEINSLHEETGIDDLFMCCGQVDLVAIAGSYTEEKIDSEKQDELNRDGAWYVKLPNGNTLYERY